MILGMDTYSDYQPTPEDLTAHAAVMAELEALEEACKRIDTRITMAVCNCEGVVTSQMNERADYIHAKLGKKWDAINCCWMPVEGY